MTTSETPRRPQGVLTEGVNTAVLRPKRSRGLTFWILVALTVVFTALMFAGFEKQVVGWLGLGVMLLLIFLRVPVAFALIIPGLIGMWIMRGSRSVEGLLASIPYEETANWTLTVIPMFILLGMLVWVSGSMNHFYNAARALVWRLPGGLAVGTSLAGAGMAAAGNSLAAAYSLGRVAVPEMLRSGYDGRVVTLTLLAPGMSGSLFPTSVLLVIYAGVVEVPVGPQLMAGLLPALATVLVFALVFVAIALIWPKRGGGSRAMRAEGRRPPKEVAMDLLRSWPLPVIVGVIAGGILTGFFTATESAAAAATIMFIAALAIFAKRRDFRPLGRSLLATISTTGMIFLLLMGANVLSAMLVQANIAAGLSEWVSNSNLDRASFIVIMAIVYIILGTGLDTLAMMLLTLPVLMPTLETLDISLLWFGVFMVLMGEIAGISPPVGVLLYAVHRLLQEKEVNMGTRISLKDVFISTTYILPGAAVIIAILIIWPELATFLPTLMSQ
jgi:tripartite ATP-independent transporter DctM subunit